MIDTILEAVRTKLTNLTYLPYKAAGERAIHILVDENLLPKTTPFPAIGLKDGGMEKTDMAANQFEKRYPVHIVAYVEILREEAPIVGYQTQKGLADIMVDIQTQLDGYLLGGIIDHVGPSQIAASEPYVTESEIFLQKQRITYIYEKWD